MTLCFCLTPKCPRFNFVNILLCMWGLCLCGVVYVCVHAPVHAHTYTQRHMHACLFIYTNMSIYACVHIEDEVGCLL